MNRLDKIKKRHILLVFVMMQLGFILVINLTKSYQFLDYDSALTIRHGWEMWKHGLFLKDWGYFSTIEIDCAGFFASGLYILTGNLNLSTALAHLSSYAAMVYVLYDLLHHLGGKNVLEKVLLSVLLIYTPYSFGQLEWSNMMFVSIGAYEYRVLLMFVLIDIFVMCEKRIYTVRFYGVFLAGVILNFWISMSTGNYVLFMILVPIALKFFVDAIRKEEFDVWNRRNIIFVFHACVSIAGWRIRNHFVGVSHRNNLSLIAASEFFTNAQNCVTGIFSLFGGLAGSDSIQLFSANGIVVLIRFSFIFVCLIYMIGKIIQYLKKRTDDSLLEYVICYAFVHLMLLVLTKTSYGTFFEYRYHILWCSLMLIYIATHMLWEKREQNRWLHNCISGGMLAGILVIHVWGGKVCSMDIKENEFLKDTIKLAGESGVQTIYFYNLPHYAHILRAVKPSLYCVNVSAEENEVPQVSAIGDFYMYYTDIAQAGTENIFICTTAEFESLPAYIQDSYMIFCQMEGDYCAYYSKMNYWDGSSGLPYASVACSTDLPFSKGYTYTGEISGDGAVVLQKQDEGYIFCGPNTQSVAGNYDISLQYEMETEGQGDCFFEVVTVQGETVLAKEVLCEKSGSVVLEDVQIAEGQDIQIRLWKDYDIVVRVKSINYERNFFL